jgi:hypothetical protein
VFMRTHLQLIVDKVTALRNEAVRLAGVDHEPAECASLLKDAGGSVETFLKAAVYPAGARGTFEKLIDDLANVKKVEAADLPPLHELRKKYNAAKHNHLYAPEADEVASVLTGAIKVLVSWRGKGIASTECAVLTKYRRRLWLASWDHFVHGDGEVRIFLPVAEDDCDFPPMVDGIYLKGLSWPDVLAPLGSTVTEAKGQVPSKFLDQWESEGDCAGVRVFNGEYRRLLRVLAPKELRFNLIPTLLRENDAYAMRAALAFAAVDVAQVRFARASAEEFRKAILRAAEADYAAPRHGAIAKAYADDLSALLATLPANVLKELDGPRFVSGRKYEELACSALARGREVLVSATPELVFTV